MTVAALPLASAQINEHAAEVAVRDLLSALGFSPNRGRSPRRTSERDDCSRTRQSDDRRYALRLLSKLGGLVEFLRARPSGATTTASGSAVTSALRGTLRTDPATRAEFLATTGISR